jgi:hypothetical protein
MNVEIGTAGCVISCLGIHTWDLRCSVVTKKDLIIKEQEEGVEAEAIMTVLANAWSVLCSQF